MNEPEELSVFWEWCCDAFGEKETPADHAAVNRMKMHILRCKNAYREYVLLSRAIATAVENGESQSLQDAEAHEPTN